MVVGESDFSTAGMERVQQTSMELGPMNSGLEQNLRASVEVCPSESDVASGVVGLRKSGSGMEWGREGMGTGTVEGMRSDQVEQSPRDSLLDVSVCMCIGHVIVIVFYLCHVICKLHGCMYYSTVTTHTP